MLAHRFAPSPFAPPPSRRSRPGIILAVGTLLLGAWIGVAVHVVPAAVAAPTARGTR